MQIVSLLFAWFGFKICLSDFCLHSCIMEVNGISVVVHKALNISIVRIFIFYFLSLSRNTVPVFNLDNLPQVAHPVAVAIPMATSVMTPPINYSWIHILPLSPKIYNILALLMLVGFLNLEFALQVCLCQRIVTFGWFSDPLVGCSICFTNIIKLLICVSWF